MDFYTAILRKSANYWVALCLENGIVGQGTTQEDAIKRLKEAIDSFQEIYEAEKNIYSAPVSIEALHEFLSAIPNWVNQSISVPGRDRAPLPRQYH